MKKLYNDEHTPKNAAYWKRMCRKLDEKNKELRKQIISVSHADKIPLFSQGMPTSVIQDIVTADMCNFMARNMCKKCNS